MVEPYINTPVIADKAISPLGDTAEIGTFGNRKNGTGVELSERFGLAIAEVAAWPGQAAKLNKIIGRYDQAFEHAPGRWTVIAEDQAMPATLTKKVGNTGTVVDLSHGRTIIRLSGPQVEWVLAKLFAIKFDCAAFASKTGRATQHHEIFAQIYRVDETTFDLIVFRSYARAFWHSLTKAAGEVGFEVV